MAGYLSENGQHDSHQMAERGVVAVHGDDRLDDGAQAVHHYFVNIVVDRAHFGAVKDVHQVAQYLDANLHLGFTHSRISYMKMPLC